MYINPLNVLILILLLVKLMLIYIDKLKFETFNCGFVVEPQFEKPALAKAMSKYKLVIKLQSADQESAFWNNK